MLWGMGTASRNSTRLAENRRRILVCLDRSALSEACVPQAVSLARVLGGSVTLLHVLHQHDGKAAPQSHDALDWEIARQEALAYLERLAHGIPDSSGVSVDVRLEQGRPAERIVDLARELDAYLTVLGRYGEGEAGMRSLGSTVQHVLALAPSSVFVANPGSTPKTTETPTRVLVPLDGSVRAESVLPTAARLAAAHDGEVLLVHIVQEPLPTALLSRPRDMELAHVLALRLESGALRYLKTLQERMQREGASVRTLVLRHLNPYQCLLETTQKEQVGLVVLSAHGSVCDSSRSFGSVTGYLLTHSVVPILVLQDLAEQSVHAPRESDPDLTPPSLRASYAPENV